MKSKLFVCLLILFGSINTFSFTAENKAIIFAIAPSVDNPGSIKGVVRAATGGTNSQSTVISNAALTLTNAKLPEFILKTVTNDAGSFIFENLPAGKYILTIEATGLPTASREIDLPSGEILNVDVDLTVTVAETVTIRAEEGLLSTSETTTSNIVRADTLKSQPFREDDFQSALTLTPGSVQDSDGKDYLKGTRAGQTRYTVNGTDAIDPSTGELAFELPLEAVASVKIEENPYSAEFGRFTGGVTNVETKGGGNEFKYSAARLFPTFRNLISTKIESFRPRVTVSGPIIKDRLFFLQSFEYRYRRTNIPSLPEPENDVILERFTSFTQLDYTINKNNLLKFNFAFFPQKTRFFGLDTFNPSETTPNVKQPGYLVSFSEQSVFKNTSFLISTVSYKTSDIDVFGQNIQPFTLMPQTNRGSYFADTHRKSNRLQVQENYYFRPFELSGKHAAQIGFEFARTNISSSYKYNSIFIRRVDDTLAQRIDFVNPDEFSYRYNEAAAFIQDRWAVNTKLTLDYGLRYDFDGVNGANNFAPRFALLFLPFKNNRTVVRAGIGLFYDRTLPVAGYFGNAFNGTFSGAALNNSNLPQRVVTNFAANGITPLAVPRFFDNQVSGDINSPRSVRWSLQIDKGITENLIFRVGYLQRDTTNELLIDPIQQGLNAGALLLSSRGESRYRELQFLADYKHSRFGKFHASYVLSRARGDLNTADVVLGDFPAFVVRSNEYAPLPFDAPHRVLLYGQIEFPFDIRVAPLFEFRSGFPYSAVNERLEFVGGRNLAGRFPKYISLDAQVTKGFDLPFFKNKRVRAGVALFNITNNFNPRDVQNNVTSPNFRDFYNSQGFGVKAQFNADF